MHSRVPCLFGAPHFKLGLQGHRVGASAACVQTLLNQLTPLRLQDYISEQGSFFLELLGRIFENGSPWHTVA